MTVLTTRTVALCVAALLTEQHRRIANTGRSEGACAVIVAELFVLATRQVRTVIGAELNDVPDRPTTAEDRERDASITGARGADIDWRSPHEGR